MQTFKFLHKMAALPLPRDVVVTWYYGPPSSGKTDRVRASTNPNDTWWQMYPRWYDGYRGQSTIVIDLTDPATRGSLPIENFFRVIDGGPTQMPVMGGFVWAQWTKVIIISLLSPERYFADALANPRTAAAFQRHRGQIAIINTTPVAGMGGAHHHWFDGYRGLPRVNLNGRQPPVMPFAQADAEVNDYI